MWTLDIKLTWVPKEKKKREKRRRKERTETHFFSLRVHEKTLTGLPLREGTHSLKNCFQMVDPRDPGRTNLALIF